MFSSDTTVVVSDGSTRPDIGDTFVVRDGRIKSKQARNNDCSSWSYLVDTTDNPLSTAILPPDSPVTPTVIIGAPERVVYVTR